jgi:hypothetical protein
VKILKTIKETFNIFKDGRVHNPVPQKFLLSALTSVLRSPMTQERIKLNEAIGYYGHRLREMTGKIRPSEVEMIEKNGKMAAVNIVPAVRTRSVSVDEQGNVTHEQEFFDTEPGRASLALYEVGSGGFSWAMSGSNAHSTPQGSVAKQFSGFDFVQQPNFIPLHRQSMLLSSVGDDTDQLILSGMAEQGLSDEKAGEMLVAFKNGEAQEDQLNGLLLSNLIEKQEDREKLLSSVISQSPFFINEAQRDALLSCSTTSDVSELNALFSAMQNTDLSHLPPDINDSKSRNEQAVPSQSSAIDYPRFDNGHVSFK